MITCFNGQLILLRDHCGKCKQKIKSNAIEPILFNGDYYHLVCYQKGPPISDKQEQNETYLLNQVILNTKPKVTIT